MLKRFIKRLLCFHPNWFEDINDQWRFFDKKYTCECCGKSKYGRFEDRPVNRDF